MKISAHRPLSFLRCTTNTSEKCFFQKHIDHAQATESHEHLIQGQKVITVDSQSALLQLVQFGVLEFHTWQCHMDHPLNPDQLIFDLDPDVGLKWSKVVEGARHMKDLLERLSLRSFLKTSGGKGLHLHVPLAPIYSWDQAKAFSKTLAQQMVQENPALYIAKSTKKDRKGKIFIDYLRNGIGATAIAPFSLRAQLRPVASVPIDWSELDTIESSAEFDIQSTLHRLAKQKKDPWQEMPALRQKIAILKPSTK